MLVLAEGSTFHLLLTERVQIPYCIERLIELLILETRDDNLCGSIHLCFWYRERGTT